ncbi:MAG TPA: baseplate J/gp47 family protein [Ktedonobacteraceae bacterium]
MADEQPVPIYLSPEEELTSVRERLERTQARRIILVIPPQTQLRSHVGWRLIHARMRELGKDLLVVSPDRQVRAVARAAGFRVAESQESSSSNRSRGGGTSTRPGSVNTRGTARSRIGSNRGSSESRGPQSQSSRSRLTPGTSNRPPAQLIPPERELYDDEDITTERTEQLYQEQEKEEHRERERLPIAPPPTLFKEPESHKHQLRDFHISTTPSVRPSVPGRDDDEVSYYDDDDYNTAKRIRESAGVSDESEQGEQGGFPPARGSRGAVSQKYAFTYMEDEQPHLPLPEQRGFTPNLFDEEVGTNVPDISDRSTEIMQNEIEDLGDLGAITPPKITSLPRPDQLSSGQRRPSGQMRQHSPRAPRPGPPDLDEDEELLAIQDRPTLTGRPSREQAGSPHPSQKLKSSASAQASVRSSQSLRPTQQPPSQILKPGAPQAGSRSSQTLRPGSAAAQVSPRGRPASQIGPRAPLFAPVPGSTVSGTARSQRASKRGGRILGLAFTVLAVLLVVLGLLFYIVPTAKVTISLQAQSYSQNIQLTASAHPQAGAPKTMQAQVLEETFSTSGQGTATGQTSVGDKQATGKVTFINNSNASVRIPTGTIVTTQSGIPFVTDAEAFARTGPNPAVPITAQQAGVSGNVAANSITSIPAASLASIADYNHITVQALSLNVTNPAITANGGARNVTAVTQADLQNLKNTLHKDLQSKISTWLKLQTHPDDLLGAPMPNALTSANPLAAEQLSGTPGVNAPAESGTFPGMLTLHISVLYASASALKNAASDLLKASILKLHPASSLADQLPITLANEKGIPSPDGKTLAISAKATGATVRQIPADQEIEIRNGLVGKSVDQAISSLKSSMAQVGFLNAQITISPWFLNLLPLRADQIQVTIQPILPQVTKNG